MTVGELRSILERADDDIPVVVYHAMMNREYDYADFSTAEVGDVPWVQEDGDEEKIRICMVLE